MNDYIATIENLIRSCFIMVSYQLNTDRRSDEVAFISGGIDFIDGSCLDFKEFIEKVDERIEKYKYAYNYRKGSVVMFRYDNAPDPGARHLCTFPDHKHTENGGMMSSDPVDLSMVLEEINRRILKDWE
jgi:hypothetical protein